MSKTISVAKEKAISQVNVLYECLFVLEDTASPKDFVSAYIKTEKLLSKLSIVNSMVKINNYSPKVFASKFKTVENALLSRFIATYYNKLMTTLNNVKGDNAQAIAESFYTDLSSFAEKFGNRHVEKFKSMVANAINTNSYVSLSIPSVKIPATKPKCKFLIYSSFISVFHILFMAYYLLVFYGGTFDIFAFLGSIFTIPYCIFLMIAAAFDAVCYISNIRFLTLIAILFCLPGIIAPPFPYTFIVTLILIVLNITAYYEINNFKDFSSTVNMYE